MESKDPRVLKKSMENFWKLPGVIFPHHKLILLLPEEFKNTGGYPIKDEHGNIAFIIQKGDIVKTKIKKRKI